jgi:hypothetical protein
MDSAAGSRNCCKTFHRLAVGVHKPGTCRRGFAEEGRVIGARSSWRSRRLGLTESAEPDSEEPCDRAFWSVIIWSLSLKYILVRP